MQAMILCLHHCLINCVQVHVYVLKTTNLHCMTVLHTYWDADRKYSSSCLCMYLYKGCIIGSVAVIWCVMQS